MKLQKIKAFTLVELIIVITILAILRTIGFMSFQSYTADARDSNRVTSIGEFKKGLEMNFLKDSKYPAPDGNIVLTGAINNQILTYVGELGENISKTIRFTSVPKDPLTQTNYIYGTTSDYRYYQVASILEGDTAYNTIINTTFANTETAKVEGNYPGFIKFNSGSESWIANIPSLIFNNTGTVNLLSSNTYFVVNKKSNLPYNTKGIKDTSIKKLDGDKLIQELTKTGTTSLIRANITGINESNFSSILTEEIIKNFNMAGISYDNNSNITDNLKVSILGAGSTKSYNTCTLSGEIIGHGQSITAFSENNIDKFASYDCNSRSQSRTCNDGVLDGTGTYQYTACVKGVINNCSADGSFVKNGHTYSIPALNHGSGATNILSLDISENNGTFKYTLSTIECNDGTYISINENSTPTIQSCNSGFGINGNICSASQNGSCNNAVALGCIIGSPINDNGNSSCGTTRTWNCSGLYGGNNSVQCILNNGSCQSNPTNLTLTHSTRSKTFNFSWTAGIGNGGSCKLQYYKNGTTWTDISATNYNCDTNLSNQSVTLPGDSWYSGNWNGVQLRVIRTSDSNVLGTLGSLLCSTTSGSSSSTTTIDEDCNGVWDNSTSVCTSEITICIQYPTACGPSCCVARGQTCGSSATYYY